MRIAIVGAGIAGLGAAWLLTRQGHAVTLFEADARLGGHTATVDVTLDGQTFPVDTGFLVFNDRTYPKLIALFDELGVASVASEMSFSCRVDRHRLEWAGTDLKSLFAQPANALRPAFWRMLADIARFNRMATAMDDGNRLWSISLGEFLDAENYSVPFRDWYLLPMAAAIWSAPRRDILDFPLPTFVRFCRNHGLLQITDRPHWRTVQGGGRVYVQKIAAQLRDVRVGTPVHRVVRTPGGVEIDTAALRGEAFDNVVLACHSDSALALLDDRRTASSACCRRFATSPTGSSCIRTPRCCRARAAHGRHGITWRPTMLPASDRLRSPISSTSCSRCRARTPVIVVEPADRTGSGARAAGIQYSHPLLDGAAVAARGGIAQLQGQRHTWYAGAWLGYGFHEDGLASAHAVADGIARRESSSGPTPLRMRVAA